MAVHPSYRYALIAFLALTVSPDFVFGEPAERPLKSQDLRAAGDDSKRYFLIDAAPQSAAPEAGYGLLIVMPGGDGSADFRPFVERIAESALPQGYLVAQPVAIKWSARQEFVWPTARDRAITKGLKFTTEEFVDAVIDDVARRHKLDPRRVCTLSWSSSGPAAYAISLSSGRVVGSFIAMSVFKPDRLPAMAAARDRAYYLYHAPKDQTCPYRMAERAVNELGEQGAKIKLVDYAGGHGWRVETAFADIRKGIDWLAANATNNPAGLAVASVKKPADAPPQPAAGPPSEIDGTWKLVSASNDGHATSPEVIKSQNFEVIVVDGVFRMQYFERKPRMVELTFEVDPTKDPKQINLHQGPNDVSLGIYKLVGDTLTICYPDGSTTAPAPDGKRSTAFESVVGSVNDVLMVLRRAKP